MLIILEQSTVFPYVQLKDVRADRDNHNRGIPGRCPQRHFVKICQGLNKSIPTVSERLNRAHKVSGQKLKITKEKEAIKIRTRDCFHRK